MVLSTHPSIVGNPYRRSTVGHDPVGPSVDHACQVHQLHYMHDRVSMAQNFGEREYPHTELGGHLVDAIGTLSQQREIVNYSSNALHLEGLMAPHVAHQPAHNEDDAAERGRGGRRRGTKVGGRGTRRPGVSTASQSPKWLIQQPPW